MNRRSFFSKVAAVWPLAALGGLFKCKGEKRGEEKMDVVAGNWAGTPPNLHYEIWPNREGVSIVASPVLHGSVPGKFLVIVNVHVDELLRNMPSPEDTRFQAAFRVDVKDGLLVNGGD